METRASLQPQKVKGGYFPWTSQESQLLKRWCDSNGFLTKRTIETKVLLILNKQLRCNKTHKHYLNRMKSLKREYQSYSDLLRFSSGFGWDPITKQFTAPDEVWEEYLKVIFESATARERNVFGHGGDATAEAFEVENNVQERENMNHMEMVLSLMKQHVDLLKKSFLLERELNPMVMENHQNQLTLVIILKNC
ncbi:hypothetical protein N665_3537s0002 [Sinapis alba]|nr:hypothetical protein N665_3537s0002 [Sinapis alba]